MSQKKEFEKVMAEFGLTEKATELVWNLYPEKGKM